MFLCHFMCESHIILIIDFFRFTFMCLVDFLRLQRCKLPAAAGDFAAAGTPENIAAMLTDVKFLFHTQFLLIHIWQRRSSAAVASVAGAAMFILAAMAEVAVMLVAVVVTADICIVVQRPR